MYIPSVIPEEDRKIIKDKYLEGTTKEPYIGNNIAIVVVDMTNGFVEDRYRTGFSKTGEPCAENIEKLLVESRKKKIPVFYTKDMDETGYPYRMLRGAWNFKSKPVNDNIKENYNTVYDRLAPEANDIIIRKSKPSAFFGTPLVALLNYMRIDSLIITGMVTSGCVRATVMDAFSYNFRVTIPIECVADRSQISHEVTLFDLDSKYASVLSLKEVTELIRLAKKADHSN